MLKCLTGLEPKFTKAARTTTLNFAPLSNIHFLTLYIHYFPHNYRKKVFCFNTELVSMRTCTCMCVHVCACV